MDTYFGKNRFVGPMTITKQCGRGGKGTKTINTLDLSDQSQIEITVECVHGQRQVRWNRRFQACKRCAVEAGAFNTSPKGRAIAWGDKISKAKKGKKFSSEHKESLTQARKERLAAIQGKDVDSFDFETKRPQHKVRLFLMRAINKSVLNKTISAQDELLLATLKYSPEDLKVHLESKFQPGMSWDNYGEWEIDHVRPHSWFDYSSVEENEFQQCWALSNLQPMWAKENKQKSNLYEGKYRPKLIYVLCGQFGCGKSTISAQLGDKFTVIDDDQLSAKERDSFITNNYFGEKPILLQLSVHISTTIRRYKDKGFQVVVFVIQEPLEVIKQRILGRGGKISGNEEQRWARIATIAKNYSNYTSSAADMLQYLKAYETTRN